MKSRSPRLATALASLRTSQWLHFCALPLAGLGGPGGWPRALVGCVIAGGCLGFAYGINAVAERRSDRSFLKNPLVGAPGVAGLAVGCAMLVATLALGLALVLGRWALLACGLSLLCGGAYSVGIAGKRVPVLGLVLNTGIFAPLMAVLLVPGQIPASWAHELAVFTLLLIQNQLIHELADDEEDRAAGARTTAQLLRGPGTVRAGVGAGLVIPLVSLGLAPTWGQALLGSAIAAVATVIACTARSDPARSRAQHRVAACAGGALLWLWARVG